MTRRLNLITTALIGAHALIVPVLIVACALVGSGGIATGLPMVGNPAAPVAYPIAMQVDGTMAISTGAPGIEFMIADTALSMGPAGLGAVANMTKTVPIPAMTGTGTGLPPDV